MSRRDNPPTAADPIPAAGRPTRRTSRPLTPAQEVAFFAIGTTLAMLVQLVAALCYADVLAL